MKLCIVNYDFHKQPIHLLVIGQIFIGESLLVQSCWTFPNRVLL